MAKPILSQVGTVMEAGRFTTVIKIDERQEIVMAGVNGIKPGDKVAVAVVKVED